MQALWTVLDPFLDPASRTWWGWWVAYGVIAVGATGPAATWRPFWTRSTGLDVQLFVGRQLLRALGVLPTTAGALGVAAGWVKLLDTVGQPRLHLDPTLLTVLYTLTLFVVWDLSRYAVHRLMHEIPALWAFHQVHHSAEVLTPLTFHRVHPVESALYSLRSVVVSGLLAGTFYWLFRGQAVEWTILGVHAIGFVLNGLTGNLRHSHVPWSFGRLEAWFLSPTQHHLHHLRNGDRVNYGTWLAIWDRALGSWAPARPHDGRFGVDERNHTDDLLSAWLGPVRSLFGSPRPQASVPPKACSSRHSSGTT